MSYMPPTDIELARRLSLESVYRVAAIAINFANSRCDDGGLPDILTISGPALAQLRVACGVDR